MPLASVTEDLAARIRRRRGALNLTQSEAAVRLGVSTRTIQNWEAGVAFPRAKHRRALDLFFATEVAV